MVRLVQKSIHKREALHIQAKSSLFMRESRDFSTSDIQLQLLSDSSIGHGVPAHFSILWLCWPSRMHIYGSVDPL